MVNPGSTAKIQHEGIVHTVDENEVTIIISSNSACSGCQAEGMCSLSGTEKKIINIPGTYNVNPGDKVTVMMNQTMGYAALLLGYIIPLLAVIVSLAIMVSFSVPELTSGLLSALILVPYYALLYLFRNRIKKEFVFTLKP
jgi:sigma-E factor negative regulatory protein RseC